MKKGGDAMREEVLEELGFGPRDSKRLERLLAAQPEALRGYLLLAIVLGRGEGRGAADWREVARRMIG